MTAKTSTAATQNNARPARAASTSREVLLTDGSVPLRYSQQNITDEDVAAVVDALRSDWLTCGPRIEAFEAALCSFTGARYAVAVNSGTAALHLSLLAAGVGEGDTVATSPLSFVASANAALYCGARPIFVDVERETGNMSARTLAEAQADPSWPGAKALIPVHYAGRPVDVQALAAQAGKGTVIIEDCAHSLGAVYSDGSTVGASVHSLAATVSFHPVKPITTAEGGAVLTSDEGFAQEVRLLRSHGRDACGRMVALGWNYRMPDVNAALGLSQLARCEANRKARRDLVAEYDYKGQLSMLPGIKLTAMDHDSWRNSAHHLFPIRIKGGKRDHVKAYLNERGIGAQIHYPAIHLQPYYAKFGWKRGDFPEAEAWSDEVLSLPLHAGMDEGDVARVVETLKEALV